MEHGGQYVMTAGTLMMPQWYVNSLGMGQLYQPEWGHILAKVVET